MQHTELLQDTYIHIQQKYFSAVIVQSCCQHEIPDIRAATATSVLFEAIEMRHVQTKHAAPSYGIKLQGWNKDKCI